MTKKIIVKFIIVSALAICILTSCRGEKYAETIHVASTMKDGGTISGDITIFVKTPRELEILKKKRKRIKQAFLIVFSEYRTSQLKSHGKRTVLMVIQIILDNRLNFDIIKFELENLIIKPRA